MGKPGLTEAEVLKLLIHVLVCDQDTTGLQLCPTGKTELSPLCSAVTAGDSIHPAQQHALYPTSYLSTTS